MSSCVCVCAYTQTRCSRLFVACSAVSTKPQPRHIPDEVLKQPDMVGSTVHGTVDSVFLPATWALWRGPVRDFGCRRTRNHKPYHAAVDLEPWIRPKSPKP